MFISWDKLPDEMKTDQVKRYYEVLLKKRMTLMMKRFFDIIFSLILLVVLSWLFIILGILIKIDSKGPVVFRQERVTTGNRDFRILKFRTMVDKADQKGSLVTTGGDMRITKVGAKIRKYRLDEIPQLLNVLAGDMTFVGTRPEVRRYVDHYSNEMMATLLLPAGITSPASILYKNEDEIMEKYTDQGMSADDAYVQHVLPEKMMYNLKYIEDFGFLRDIKIMWDTVVGVIK